MCGPEPPAIATRFSLATRPRLLLLCVVDGLLSTATISAAPATHIARPAAGLVAAPPAVPAQVPVPLPDTHVLPLALVPNAEQTDVATCS
jgi:hypothetical protein